MEVVIIERKAFEALMADVSSLTEKVNRLCGRESDRRMAKWMDNEEVCRLLRLSPRTLQTMRENGTLAYTKISHKVYYRPEDVKAVFPVAEMKRCITAGKERKCNVTNKPTNEPTNKPTNKQTDI